MATTFIGRERELKQLAITLGQARPTISVVYARRRVGKSALIRQAVYSASEWGKVR
jgi:AAA+ ATPase superfamily predicted ATPase